MEGYSPAAVKRATPARRARPRKSRRSKKAPKSTSPFLPRGVKAAAIVPETPGMEAIKVPCDHCIMGGLAGRRGAPERDVPDNGLGYRFGTAGASTPDSNSVAMAGEGFLCPR